MFTDGPVTPMWLEVLVELLRHSEEAEYDREQILQLLQPRALIGVDHKREQAKLTLKAASELRIISDEKNTISLSFQKDDSRTTQQIILESLDEHVLGKTDVEPYFAPFYSYLLSLGKAGAQRRLARDWAQGFETDVFGGRAPKNPFNETKYNGLQRWYRYAGLGWEDMSGAFQANPYERMLRRLPVLFSGKKSLDSSDFIRRLGEVCPELDGGSIFMTYSRGWKPEDKKCTLGLSHALIDLHMGGHIRLRCPQDSWGWSLAEGSPPDDGQTLKSEKIEKVELV